MSYNNVPLHVKSFETVVFLRLCLKCWARKNESKVYFIAIAEQMRKLLILDCLELCGHWVFSASSRACWMLSHLGAKWSFPLCKGWTEGFINAVKFLNAAITNYLPCSSYTRVSPGVGNSVPFILESVSMGGGFAFLSLFFCSRATRPSAFICIIPPPFHVWFPLKVKQIHFKPRHVLKHSGHFFKGTWYICFQKVVVKIYWLCLQMSLKCGVSEKLSS